MKKLLEISPLIIAGLVVLVVVTLFATGAFDAPEETQITSSTLIEVLNAEKLTAARYIQHGIAKSYVEDQNIQYILYYAVVEAYVQLSDIMFEIDNETKIVTMILPEKLEIYVELLQDEEHEFEYHPKDAGNWTGKDVRTVCETDARQKAEVNTELLRRARDSIIRTISVLLSPILSANGYTLVAQ